MKKQISKILELIVIGAAWFILDHAVKSYVMTFNVGEQITPSIFGIFRITFVKNTGAAFGLFANNPVPLAILSLAIFGVLIALYIAHLRRLSAGTTLFSVTHLHTFSLAIVCAGGISNVIDRLTLGYVVDYIDLDFMTWPVFNIADIGVTCGIILLVIAMIYNYIKVAKIVQSENSKNGHLDSKDSFSSQKGVLENKENRAPQNDAFDIMSSRDAKKSDLASKNTSNKDSKTCN